MRLQEEGHPVCISFHTKARELEAEARRIALAAARHFDRDRYSLYAAVCMPDHMHLILTPCLGPRGKPWTLVRIAGSIKSYSAHQINRRAGRLGPVWQRGFYDRIVRSESDLEEKVRYLWENPVRAGIVEAPEDYPFAWNRWYHTDAES